MAEVKKTQVCKCENCGNEAEMMVTCSLEDEEAAKSAEAKAPQEPTKVKGTATCSNCGNEADMWIDI